MEAKVLIECFKDLPNHTHTLDDIEKIKLKEYAKGNLNLDESVKELKRKEVTNIKYKVHGPLDAHLIRNPKRSLDIQESISFLEQQEHKVEHYSISHNSSKGLVFIVNEIEKDKDGTPDIIGKVVEVDISEKDNAERASKNRLLVVNKLIERTRDVY
ncbi:16734_t:CDS:2 [Gigaspora margarita]|uniref:16734_t:CDS:1 n=1 Tax=Gigaspora margarita TaxID=4874 RepID=A0ABN7V2N6_GIGMA|nr:16734_t:CDS:2 [Gigaspora margarita]